MYTIAIILLGVLPPALMLALGRKLRAAGELNPMAILGWAAILGYSIKSLFLAYAVNNGVSFRTSELSAAIIPLGQIAVVVGFAALVAGYLLVRTRVTGVSLDRLPQLNHRTAVPLYYAAFAVSVLLMLTYFAKMGFFEQVMRLEFVSKKFYIMADGSRTSLGFLTIGGDLLLVYLLYWICFARRLSFFSIYVFAISFVASCYFFASRRSGILLILVSAMMVAAGRGARLAPKPLALGAAILALAAVPLLFVGAIRDGGGEKTLADLDLHSAVQVSATQFVEGAYFLDPAKTATIIARTDESGGFLYGESFGRVIFAPIPRLLWPDKPAVRIGPYVANEALNYNNHSGAPPGAVGEFYLNFGWPGVVLGMMLLGMATAWLHASYLGHPDKRYARPAYILMMLCVILFLYADFALFTLSALRYAVGIYICVQFWRAVEARRCAAC